ncbi:hypothetical protein MPH_12941 [Macrophomina phaseolina MS6]|uniref:Uncharacterized protein n=1 Tax=Macrophomina phaseolina (strain MS6) TaxID=1126212 RepID=K2RIQ7_MACPH|nr:hypothetical protein MPH_12941 [Macrophomina phaseolina MS6]
MEAVRRDGDHGVEKNFQRYYKTDASMQAALPREGPTKAPCHKTEGPQRQEDDVSERHQTCSRSGLFERCRAYCQRNSVSRDVDDAEDCRKPRDGSKRRRTFRVNKMGQNARPDVKVHDGSNDTGESQGQQER